MLLTIATDTSKVDAQETEWKLVFSDEFNQPNGSQPDAGKWNRTKPGTSPWNRWISSNSNDVVYVKNGKLICRAIPNRSKGLFQVSCGSISVIDWRKVMLRPSAGSSSARVMAQ